MPPRIYAEKAAPGFVAGHKASRFASEVDAWALLRVLSKCGAASFRSDLGLCLNADGLLTEVAPEDGLVTVSASGGLEPSPGVTGAVSRMLSLYLPLCDLGGEPLGFAHVSQSLDGQIALQDGSSRYLSGQEDLEHTHRLRALCDAVLIGASTAFFDDPQLTTRLVPGENPTRVALDPQRRLSPELRLFRDAAAPTLVICARGRRDRERLGNAELIEVEAEAGVLPPRRIVAALAERGLSRLFIEGGGITISRFIEARALSRLHVTVCPVFVGQGRPSISLPPIAELSHALRPGAKRFMLGDDVLFDCRLLAESC